MESCDPELERNLARGAGEMERLCEAFMHSFQQVRVGNNDRAAKEWAEKCVKPLMEYVRETRAMLETMQSENGASDAESMS